MKYTWIRERRCEFPVALACRILCVSRSGYYKSQVAKSSARGLRHEAIKLEVQHFYERSRGVYGYRKVAADIREEGESRCCAETVRRIMREDRLCAKTKHKFVVTTQSRHSLPVAENVVGRDFRSASADRKWVSDMTYIRTMEGWLYLAGVLDLYSRRVVGWGIGCPL